MNDTGKTCTPPTTCGDGTHSWPGEASADPTPCVCGEKTMTVTYSDPDFHAVKVERRESTYAAVCAVCGDLGGAAARFAVEDLADEHQADAMRVHAANLGGGGA